jgi:hypothetical protein
VENNKTTEHNRDRQRFDKHGKRRKKARNTRERTDEIRTANEQVEWRVIVTDWF